jgi:hypothetical protein
MQFEVGRFFVAMGEIVEWVVKVGELVGAQVRERRGVFF